MQLRKLAASALGALMTGATLAFPAAAASLADYPQPFISDSEANLSIVVGSNAKVADVASAIDVAVTLGGQPTTQKTVETGGARQVSISKGTSLDTPGNHLIKGDALDNSTKTLRSGDLGGVLEKTTFKNEDGDDLTSRTSIDLSTVATVDFDKTGDSLDAPVINLDTGSGDIYNLTWNPDSFMPNNTQSKDVKMFGKTLTFAGSNSDLKPSKFVMYGASATQTVNTGETVTMEGADISVLGANANEGTATIEVGGEQKSVTSGNQYSIGGEKIFVEDVFITTIPTKTASVKLSVGSEEWVFEDGEKLSIGGDSVDGTTVHTDYSSSSGKVNDVTIEVKPSDLDGDNNPQGYDEYNYIENGKAFVDPTFGTFKVAFGGLNVPLDSDQRNDFSIESDGDNLKFTFTNAAGNQYSMDLVNESMILEVDGTPIYTDSSDKIAEDEYFIVNVGSDNQYTHILEVSSVDNSSTSPECEILDVATGEDVGIFQDAAGQDECVLSLEAEKTMTIDGENDKVKASGWNYDNELHTENGLNVSLTNVSSTNETFWEEDFRDLKTTETAADSGSITLMYDGSTDNRAEISSVSADTASVKSVSDEDNLGLTEYGTYITYDDEDQLSATLSVPSQEVYYKLLAGPEAATVTTSAGGKVTYQSIVPITSSVSQLDTAVTETEKTNAENNMILVGGPCVNMLTQELLNDGKLQGVNANETQCFNQWTEDTPEVQLVENAFVDGQTALVVAGMTKEDTANAAAALQDIAGLPDQKTLNV